MLERAGDYLARRAQKLDLGREELLAEAQKLLDELYPSQARALSFNNETLKIVTRSAPVASELRFRQVQILKRLSGTTHQVKKLQIQIRG